MTDELKKAIENAKTEEDKKVVVEKFKDEIRELTPEELEGVAGGVAGPIEVLAGNDSTNCENKYDVH